MRPRIPFQEDQFSTPITIELDTTSEPAQPIMLIWQGDEYAAICVDHINFPDFLRVLQYAYDDFGRILGASSAPAPRNDTQSIDEKPRRDRH